MAKVGWTILAALAGLLLLNGVTLYAYVETHTERTIGLLLAAFGALALLVALDGRRSGTRGAWYGTWVVVGSLGAIGAHMLRGDRLDLQVLYLGLAAVALAGQLLAGRAVRP